VLLGPEVLKRSAALAKSSSISCLRKLAHSNRYSFSLEPSTSSVLLPGMFGGQKIKE
jgi:hypothetical protein